MLDAYCRGCGAVVLLWPANIEALSPSPHGTVVHFRCVLGHFGVELVERDARRKAAA